MTGAEPVRRLIGWLACRIGVHHASRRLHRRQLLICCYHGVREDSSGDDHWLLLPRRQFTEQLEYLSRHYRCLPVDEALEALRAGRLTEPTACITFDDGYANNRSIALPILESLRLPATIYLTTGLVGTERRLWTTALELAIRRTPLEELDLESFGHGKVALGSDAERARLASRITEALKLRPVAEREAILSRLHADTGSAGAEDAGAFAMMGWDDARDMLATGLVTFGAHTINHDVLSRVDDVRVASEVEGSMRRVAEELGECRTFAFPNGREIDFDARAIAAVRRAGGTAAMSTREGLNGAKEDFFALRRVVVGPEMSMDAFRLHTSGVVPLAKAVLRRVRAIFASRGGHVERERSPVWRESAERAVVR